MDVRSLWKEGHTIRDICRLTGLSRNTVRGVIRSDGPRAYERKPGLSKLTPFEETMSTTDLLERIEALPPAKRARRGLRRVSQS